MITRKKLSIKDRQLLAFFSFAIIPIILSSFLLYQHQTNYTTREIELWLNSFANIQEKRLFADIRNYQEKTSLIASRTQLRISLDNFNKNKSKADKVAIAKIIRDVKESIEDISGIAIYSLHGELIYASGSVNSKELSDRHKSLYTAKNSVQITNVFGNSDASPRLELSTGLFLKKQIIGLLIVTYNAKSLVYIAEDNNVLGSLGETLIAKRDANRNIVYIGHDIPKLGFPLAGENSAEVINQIFAGKESIYKSGIIDYRNLEVLVATRYLAPYDLAVIVKIDKKQAFVSLIDFKRKLLLIMAVTAILAFLIAIRSAIIFTEPIYRLKNAISAYREGRVETLEIFAERTYEFSELMDEFNRLVAAKQVVEKSAAHHTKELEKQRRAILNIALDAKEAEEKSKRAEEYFRAAIEGAPNGMLIIDSAGRISLINAQISQMFGYSSQELLGTLVEVLIPRRFRETHPAYRNSFFDQPGARAMGVGRELFGLRKNGTEFPVEIGLNPIYTDKGIYVLSSIVDITERKRKEEEMEQLLYVVSHDLKSPLVTTQGFIGLLQGQVERGDREQIRDSIERVKKAANRMSELIDDLLQLGRIGYVEEKTTLVNLREVVKNVVSGLTLRLEKAGAKVEIKGNLPAPQASSHHITQLMENLISNAIKYGCTKPGSIIEIGGSENPGDVLFYVKDEGPGIPEKYRENIFRLFHRLDTSREGTGVGLAIVKKIVSKYNGAVWIESPPEGGNMFWIRIPKRF